MKIVEFISVTKRYRLGGIDVTALDRVNLCVQQGDFVAITGPSGSGKTSLLNLIACLDTPTDGEVRVMEQPVRALDERQIDQLRSRSFGMIFQDFHLVPVLTAFENVMLPLHLHRLPRAQMRQRTEEVLHAVGLEGRAGAWPEQLSGGQRQRLAIARALVTRPRLILADEPTASLDTGNALALVALMKQLNEESGVTFVFSTHDERLLRQVKRVLELRDGRLSVARGVSPVLTRAPAGRAHLREAA
jgi:putative ABC transport system ATP-binding protein